MGQVYSQHMTHGSLPSSDVPARRCVKPSGTIVNTKHLDVQTKDTSGYRLFQPNARVNARPFGCIPSMLDLLASNIYFES